MKITLFSVGKTKEVWLEEGVHEYVKRLSPVVRFEFCWFKDAAALETALAKEKLVILLDSNGKMMTSEEFGHFVFHALEKLGAHISFAIGGPEGFSETLKEQFPRISLSRMTFTHQLSRLILMEQLYRIFEIRKGSKYHK